MSTHKYIYWSPDTEDEGGYMFANVHLLVGYNGATITDYQEMAKELRLTFPQATDDSIQGGRIFKSSSVDGFTIIAWKGYIPKQDYPGWSDKGGQDYFW